MCSNLLRGTSHVGCIGTRVCSLWICNVNISSRNFAILHSSNVPSYCHFLQFPTLLMNLFFKCFLTWLMHGDDDGSPLAGCCCFCSLAARVPSFDRNFQGLSIHVKDFWCRGYRQTCFFSLKNKFEQHSCCTPEWNALPLKLLTLFSVLVSSCSEFFLIVMHSITGSQSSLLHIRWLVYGSDGNPEQYSRDGHFGSLS